jgi:cyclohexanecarboxylate-CoA ligase
MNAKLESLRQEYRRTGIWKGITFDRLLSEHAEKAPNKIAIVANRGLDEDRKITYRELDEMVSRYARALNERDIRAGDIVTVQLPNWWEFVVICLACSRVGIVVNPVMPILRERELEYILNFSASKAFIFPKSFRGFDYIAMVEGMAANLPHLRQRIVVGGGGEDSFERLLGRGEICAHSADCSQRLSPDDVSVLMFTSGTTGTPKGVMHTSNTISASMNAFTDRCMMSEDDVLLVASPVGHMTGYSCVLLSIFLGATMILQDVWEPSRAVDLIVRDGVTFTVASTPFLSDVCDEVERRSAELSLRIFICGGAPIPPDLVTRATKHLGATVCSLWGMTEALSATLTPASAATEKSATTDGAPTPGIELRVVDDNSNDLPMGQPGRLLVRGASVFVGYYKQPDLPAFDSQGWLDTGDVAYVNEEGYIRICGRTKDIIIRGGENIPVVEIENLLFSHPDIKEVAIVGYPDARLGERACAFIEPKAGRIVDLASIQNYLAGCRTAKQFWPERVEVVATLQRTATGKIQKFKLRETAKDFGVSAA